MVNNSNLEYFMQSFCKTVQDPFTCFDNLITRSKDGIFYEVLILPYSKHKIPSLKINMEIYCFYVSE